MDKISSYIKNSAINKIKYWLEYLKRSVEKHVEREISSKTFYNFKQYEELSNLIKNKQVAEINQINHIIYRLNMLYGNNRHINSVGNVEDNNNLANMLLARGIAEYFNFKYLSIRNHDVIDFMGALMSNTYDYKNPHSQYRPDWMNNTQGWRSDYQTKTLALQSGPSFARSHMFNAKKLKNIQSKVKIDEETLKKKYGRDVPISWIEPKDIKKFIKSPTK